MIYILTSGEYSDYTIDGVYKGKEGMDLKQLRRDFEKVWNESEEGAQSRRYREIYKEWEASRYSSEIKARLTATRDPSQLDAFRDWLVKECGLVDAEKDCQTEWWIGSYERAFDIEREEDAENTEGTSSEVSGGQATQEESR